MTDYPTITQSKNQFGKYIKNVVSGQLRQWSIQKLHIQKVLIALHRVTVRNPHGTVNCVSCQAVGEILNSNSAKQVNSWTVFQLSS